MYQVDSDEERRARLDFRLKKYHGVCLAEIMELIDYLRGPDDTVIAGGSLAYDLGNSLSDFDMVISGPASESSRVPLEHWLGSLRIDVWTRSHAAIGRLFGHAVHALCGEQPIQNAFGTPEEDQQLKLLHRVAYGLRLDGPALSPGAEHGHLKVACELVVREYGERMRESILLAQLCADPLAAAANARLAVEECLQTVLARRGVPFTGDKWLTERLATAATDLREAYQPFTTLPIADDAVSAFVADAIGLCGRLSGLALDQGSLVKDLHWTVADTNAVTASGEMFLLTPKIGAMWRLSDHEAQVWRDLAADTQGEAMSWRADQCDPDRTRLLTRLYGQGIASLVWDRGVAALETTEDIG